MRLLLIGLVLTSALAFAATDWTGQLELVPLAGIVGLIAGMLLSSSSFRGLVCHLFSAIYGVAWVGFLVGQGLPGDLSWRERICELAGRIGSFVQQALSGGTSQDSLIFLLFLCILFWFLAYNAAWNTYRHRRPWMTALPLAIASIVAVHFYIGEAPLIRYLIVYLLLALLYLGRAYTSREEETWRRERVAYDPELGREILRSSFVLALVALTIAWALPSTSSASTSISEIWERINAPWETVQEEWQRLFSSVHSGEIEIAEPFGSSLALGGPSSLEDTIVLDIEAPPVGRYYWRGTVYATYDGSQWELPGGDVIPVSAGRQAIASASDASRRLVMQTVTNYLPGRRLLVGAPQLVAVDREAETLARAEGGTPLAFHRVSSILPLGAGEQYTVTSRVCEADAPSLRQAGTDYPLWVSERYLQLPSSLPERVQILAERVTAGAGSAYDEARLLERYLRDTIIYDLSPPPVPPGRDYVDFLLFESQRDYCNGYATAMVVMARSLDIPARLATGYAEGEYDEERHVFRVRENNAHSWPEIYFPGYGWVEFEPTVSQDPLIRPEPVQGGAAPEPQLPLSTGPDLIGDLMREGEAYPPLPDDAGGPSPASDRPVERAPLWPWAAGALGLLALAAAGWWAVENLGFRRLPAAERAYARLLRFGNWLGRPLRIADTPLEWMRDLAAMMPKAEEPLHTIVSVYDRARFGQGDSWDLAANVSWSQARPMLWRRLLWEQWLERLRLSSEAPDTEP